MRLSAAAAAALVLAAATAARAAEYEVFVDVDDEEGLIELLESGQISSETFTTLIELLRQGVDLDRATREELYSLPNLTYDDVDKILFYRREAGSIGDPQNLVAAGALEQRKLDALAPFLRVRVKAPVAYATDGWVRAPLVFLPNAPDTPAGALMGRAVTVKHLSFGGAAVVTTHRLGDVVYDPVRESLSAQAAAPRVAVPKLFVRWEEDGWGVIAGSYRIGFGQRLTFDDTSRYTPSGFVPDDDIVRGTSLTSACKESQGELDASPCAGAAGDEYVVPDFRWREGLFGVAVGARQLAAGPGELQLYGFFSSARRPIYQYEIYDRGRCDDPERDDDPACAAPAVYRTQDDPLAPTSRFSYQTLPDMFRETTVGGNVSYFTGPTTHVGATWYLSSIDWLTEGIDLDFQEYSRYPRGGAFGAVGVDGALRVNDADVFVEVTRSFDRTPGGGGDFGAILRTVAAFRKQELEASLRWYGEGFVNPYARPIAAADESGGQRVRDEAGMRLRYTGAFWRRFTLRASWDLWVTPSTDTPKTVAYVRADTLFTRTLGGGLWASFSDKDLSQGGGAMECYETPFDTDESGEPLGCTGRKWQAALRVHVMPSKRLTVSAQYQHGFLDDPDYPDGQRQDVSAWLAATWKPTDRLRVRGRSRFLDQDVADNMSLERSLWSYLELSYRYQKQWRARARYDLILWLDDRASTAVREPNPEMWLWLEMEARF
jgi:hypothetical protein